MILAKAAALVGVVLFAGGTSALLPGSALAVASVLLLIAAVCGAVALEGRDLDSAAGLVSDGSGALSAVDSAPVAVPADLPAAA